MRDRGKGAGRELTKGIVRTNPLLVLMVGLCSALAISTRVESCIFMGAAVIFVTVCSNVIISLIRGFIPDQIRIPIFIVVIASFVTIVDLTLKTQPAIYERLGVWIPLIVVNCLILARAEGFASGSGVYRSFMDGLGIGLGYTVVILIMSVFRELFGTGKIVLFNTTLIDLKVDAMPKILIMFPGAFITFALLLACLQWYQDRRKPKGKGAAGNE
ncbi:MAG: electron transport complex subunit RsxE [Actinomycetota bacterium]|nr:electron transport complex subunit RsxE [Actinomycetota bacterium]MDD5666529.1 electron transport complex subunit RsxE [Actinomycetota bacterium]